MIEKLEGLAMGRLPVAFRQKRYYSSARPSHSL